MEIRECKKCLLLESGEKDVFKTVSEYLQTVDEGLKADTGEYEARLQKCRTCSYLISGMCIKCGCYVEIRAALKDKECPDVDDKKW